MKKTLVFCTDSNYLQHLSVCINSASGFNTLTEWDIFVIYNNCGENELDQFVKSVYPIKLNLIESKKLEGKGFFVNKHISIATYQRIYLSELLPLGISKFLYLDCDIIINSALTELFQYDLKGMPIGAVPELGLNAKTNTIFFLDYFNAGVLLVDRTKWDELSITERLIKFIEENFEKLEAWDQSALNGVLKALWTRLPVQWNVTSLAFRHKNSLAKLLNGTKPGIIHFNATIKPWHYRQRHPFKIAYFSNLHNSYRSGFRWPDRTLMTIARKAAARCLIFLGIKSY